MTCRLTAWDVLLQVWWVSNRNSAYPAAQTLQQPQNPGQSQAESSGVEGKGEPVAGQTEAGAIPVANEPQVRTEPVTYETEGAPVASNSIEGKLAKFREDMQEGKHDPHHRSQVTHLSTRNFPKPRKSMLK